MPVLETAFRSDFDPGYQLYGFYFLRLHIMFAPSAQAPKTSFAPAPGAVQELMGDCKYHYIDLTPKRPDESLFKRALKRQSAAADRAPSTASVPVMEPQEPSQMRSRRGKWQLKSGGK